MAKWDIFYNILGFKGGLRKPNSKTLLGLDGEFTKTDVLNALDHSKKMLRNNLPSNDLLGQLFEFERKVLDPAAEELLNTTNTRDKELSNDEQIQKTLITLENTKQNDDSALIDTSILDDILPDDEPETTNDVVEEIPFSPEFAEPIKFNGKKIAIFFIVFLGLLFFVSLILMTAGLLKKHSDLKSIQKDYLERPEYIAKPEDDTFQTDLKETMKNIIKKFTGNKSAKKKLSGPKAAILTEAEFSKINTERDFNLNTCLSRISSSLLSCCDRISKIESKRDIFKKHINKAGLIRKVDDRGIDISLSKITITDSNLEFNQKLDKIREELLQGNEEEKFAAIERLEEINNETSRKILIETIERSRQKIQSRSLVNRCLEALLKHPDKKTYKDLTELIAESSSATLASMISIKLEEHTGIPATQDGLLPLKNSHDQRVDCSIWWDDKLSEYKPEKKIITLNDPNSITIASVSLPEEQIAFGQNLIFLRSFDSILKNKEDKNNQNEFSTKANLAAIDTDFKELSSSIANSFEIMAREKIDSKEEQMQLDFIEKKQRVKLLACENGIQETAVNFGIACDYLELINRQLDERGWYTKVIDDLISRKNIENGLPRNSFEQLQFESYYLLRYLDLIIQQQADNILYAKVGEDGICDPNNL